MKKEVVNTYVAMGFKTVPRNHKDNFALEVVNAILGRGQSGKMFTEIRSNKGLAYDVGTQNVGEVSFGYFAAYAIIEKKNVALVRKLILKEISKKDYEMVLKVPLNGKLNALHNDWVCKRGFFKTGNRCLQVRIPKNAKLNFPSELINR